MIIQKRLVDFLLPYAENLIVSDVRIGLGYTAVKLDNGYGGVAATQDSPSTSCTHFNGAGNLAGSSANKLLTLLGDEGSSLARSIGLATANALIASMPVSPVLQEEIVSSLNITSNDRVVMVGYFAPIAAQLRQAGCQMDILELNDKFREALPPEKASDALKACTVAIITGTSIINATFDDLHDGLGEPRAAVLLGPSSPMCSDVFKDSKITHVAGARVRDTDAILRVVSEGGGTMLMKQYLDFEAVLIKSGSTINS